MNSALLTDPVVLISAAIIVVGLIAFFWAVGKFKSAGAPAESGAANDMLSSAPPAIPDIDFRAPEMSVRAPVPSAPAVSPEVAERLESMSQRLSEMQNVLMKQSSSSGGTAVGAAGGVGQGFSPETIEKLLKIIGNVIQQVDILQKSLNISK